MRPKTVLIFLFLGSLVVLGGVLWRNATPTAVAADTIQPPATMVLVAMHPLGTGTLLRAEDVKWQNWDDPLAPGLIVRPVAKDSKTLGDADVPSLLDVYGAVVRERIDAGHPIPSDAIVKPGDRGFLAAVLAPGYRAMTISVTAVSGAAGLIFPGDHVDVLLTQTFPQGEEPAARRSVAETIVSDTRVVAIDQRVQQVAVDPAKTDIPIARTVTLEALPRQAEMINVAAELGKLSLTLRSVPTDGDAAASTDPAAPAVDSVWADDVSPALRQSGKKVVAGTPLAPIRIIRGGDIAVWKQ